MHPLAGMGSRPRRTRPTRGVRLEKVWPFRDGVPPEPRVSPWCVLLLGGLMERGYVKLWRKTLDSGIMQNPVAWQVLGYLMLNAAWKKNRYLTKLGMIELEPGQLVTGRKKMAEELRSTEKKIRTALELLAKCDIVGIETANSFSIITLKNWGVYQSDETQRAKEGPTEGQGRANEGPQSKKDRKKEQYTEDFEDFWKAYPKKVSKGAAAKEWAAYRPPLDECLKTLTWQKLSVDWTKEGGKYIPDPERWIKKQRWLDEQASVTPNYDPMTHWPDGRKKTVL